MSSAVVMLSIYFHPEEGKWEGHSLCLCALELAKLCTFFMLVFLYPWTRYKLRLFIQQTAVNQAKKALKFLDLSVLTVIVKVSAQQSVSSSVCDHVLISRDSQG